MGIFSSKPASPEEMSNAKEIADGAIRENRVMVFSKVREITMQFNGYYNHKSNCMSMYLPCSLIALTAIRRNVLLHRCSPRTRLLWLNWMSVQMAMLFRTISWNSPAVAAFRGCSSMDHSLEEEMIPIYLQGMASWKSWSRKRVLSKWLDVILM